MDEATKQLKAVGNPHWKRLLVESFETSMADPGVSSKVQTYIVPQTDPRVALRGQMGLKTTQDCDMFAVGIYRSRTMLEFPTFSEIERSVIHVLGPVHHRRMQACVRVLGALAANCQTAYHVCCISAASVILFIGILACIPYFLHKPVPCWRVLSKGNMLTPA